ncbi:alpha/beta-hydrolase [Apiospora saccharicola]|uniref:Carboxylic ester hydrolase n=1 Tax=Apiospora saccharicola TaxID=335842 RepID=A0ABR1U3P1_9PEZI
MLLRSLFAAALAATTTMAASLQAVTGFGTNPSQIQMYIYVPDKLATKPAVVVALHPCGGSGQQWFSGTRPTVQYADQLGFILIYPSTPHMSNCWDVQNAASLTHGAGGDATSIVQMVNYTLTKYSGDAERVYVFGSSSGGMMTNVIAGTYPEVFAAGSATSGTAFACFAGAPSATPFSPNQTCAQGLQHTPADWGKFVRNAYPGYTGKRPRMMIWHGTADGLVRPQCALEALKQWSDVLGVPDMKTVANVPASPYTQYLYGDGSKVVGYMGQGLGHMPAINDKVMLTFFGLLS